jgi:hypothetical protein
MPPRRARLGLSAPLTVLACLLALLAAPAAAEARQQPPRIEHLFLIVLENRDASTSFGPASPAPYLARTLRRRGAFLPNYYGIGHASLVNYLALASGQPPNRATAANCRVFEPMRVSRIRGNGVAVGEGCVFPRRVQTVANQLKRHGLRWRAYMQDMASSAAAGEATSCRHPAIGAVDGTQAARPGDQYATRHNPFVYFRSVIDFPSCRRDVVDLGRLRRDLRRARTTPAYAFISPDLCADGHDETCADGTSPGGYAGIDAFLRRWVPLIEASPAYRDHGAILVTFDESESSDASCCGQRPGPNLGTVSATGELGGGRVGAVVLSPCVRPGSVARRPYNHYSTLRWVEDNFRLSRLGFAGARGLAGFGRDVLNRPRCR